MGAVTRSLGTHCYHIRRYGLEIISQANVIAEFDYKTGEVELCKATELGSSIVPRKCVMEVVPTLP